PRAFDPQRWWDSRTLRAGSSSTAASVPIHATRSALRELHPVAAQHLRAPMRSGALPSVRSSGGSHVVYVARDQPNIVVRSNVSFDYFFGQPHALFRREAAEILPGGLGRVLNVALTLRGELGDFSFSRTRNSFALFSGFGFRFGADGRDLIIKCRQTLLDFLQFRQRRITFLARLFQFSLDALAPRLERVAELRFANEDVNQRANKDEKVYELPQLKAGIVPPLRAFFREQK